MATYFEQSLAALARFEGSVPWMYLDTVGKVTVGVGRMLPDAAAAEALPFAVSGRPATPAEIAAEFHRVEALPMGRPALFYRAAGKPELPPGVAADLLRTVLLRFETELRSALAGYDALPDGVKLALLDMAYNLGPRALLSGYPRMLAAIARGDWKLAAAQSNRRGPGAERNAWTRQQLLGSVLQTVKAGTTGLLGQLGFGLLGMSAAALAALRSRLRPKTPL